MERGYGRDKCFIVPCDVMGSRCHAASLAGSAAIWEGRSYPIGPGQRGGPDFFFSEDNFSSNCLELVCDKHTESYRAVDTVSSQCTSIWSSSRNTAIASSMAKPLKPQNDICQGLYRL
jgi:hypothetical protein